VASAFDATRLIVASAFDAVRLIVASAFDAVRLIVASAFDAMRQRLLDSMPLGVPVPLPLPLVGLTLVCVRLLPAYQLPAIRSQCARVGQKPARNKALSSQAVAESRHVDSRVCLLTQKREDSARLVAKRPFESLGVGARTDPIDLEENVTHAD